MRPRKKEAVDSIAQKIANSYNGKYITQLWKIATSFSKNARKTPVLSSGTVEYRFLLNSIDWLYGYDEDEIPGLIEELKAKMENMLADKDSSYTRILSCIACHCVLSKCSIENLWDDTTSVSVWEGYTLPIESPKILMCLDVLKKYCPNTIEPENFEEARGYIRMWNSEYNW